MLQIPMLAENHKDGFARIDEHAARDKMGVLETDSFNYTLLTPQSEIWRGGLHGSCL